MAPGATFTLRAAFNASAVGEGLLAVATSAACVGSATAEPEAAASISTFGRVGWSSPSAVAVVETATSVLGGAAAVWRAVPAPAAAAVGTVAVLAGIATSAELGTATSVLALAGMATSVELGTATSVVLLAGITAPAPEVSCSLQEVGEG